MPSITPHRWLLVSVLALTGCAGAAHAPLLTSTVSGAGFLHHFEIKGTLAGAQRVHVYLEGDGRPYATRYLPATDPTPRRRLARELMALDPSPSLYLARPCYEGRAGDRGCASALWTDARYGEAVVASMAAALEALRAAHAVAHVTLVGYSGGGTLAMLLAPRVAAVDSVVTIAANLDLKAWAARHGYAPLHMSLDPATQAPLPAEIAQWHFVGADDTNVPPALVERALAHDPAATIVVVAADHAKGWTSAWPQLLRQLDAAPE